MLTPVPVVVLAAVAAVVGASVGADVAASVGASVIVTSGVAVSPVTGTTTVGAWVGVAAAGAHAAITKANTNTTPRKGTLLIFSLLLQINMGTHFDFHR